MFCQDFQTIFVKILKLIFGQDFENEVLSRFWDQIYVKILRLNLGKDFEYNLKLNFDAT